jgi:hypothetical protein
LKNRFLFLQQMYAKSNGKTEVIPKAPFRKDEWRSGGIAPPFLTSALDEGKWSTSRFGRFISEETVPGTIAYEA